MPFWYFPSADKYLRARLRNLISRCKSQECPTAITAHSLHTGSKGETSQADGHNTGAGKRKYSHLIGARFCIPKKDNDKVCYDCHVTGEYTAAARIKRNPNLASKHFNMYFLHNLELRGLVDNSGNEM